MLNLLEAVHCVEFKQNAIDRGHVVLKYYYVEYGDEPTTYSSGMESRSLAVKENELIIKYNELIHTGDFYNIEDVSINILHKINDSVSQSIGCEFYDTPFTGAIIMKFYKLLGQLDKGDYKRVIIVPTTKIYDILSSNTTATIDVYINKSEFYRDKVFVLNSNDELGVPHLGLVTTKLIPKLRALKIMKVCDKFSKPELRYFKYNIIPIDKDYKKHFGVINLY